MYHTYLRPKKKKIYFKVFWNVWKAYWPILKTSFYSKILVTFASTVVRRETLKRLILNFFDISNFFSKFFLQGKNKKKNINKERTFKSEVSSGSSWILLKNCRENHIEAHITHNCPLKRFVRVTLLCVLLFYAPVVEPTI